MKDVVEAAQLTRSLWDVFVGSRDHQARIALIEHYMPLAHCVAARVYRRDLRCSRSFDDYLQYARVGLIEAVDRFDAGRKVSFEAYSTHRIRGAILNGLAQESEAAAQREARRVRIAARTTSLAAQQRIEVQEASLQDLIDITVGIALGMVLEDDELDPIDESHQANPYAATELAQFSRLLKELVEKLPRDERDVIKGHYFEQLEFQSIAQCHRLTKGRVSQLHGRALHHLRDMLNQSQRLDRKL